MQITSGLVSYARVVKDDDYGIKREAKVELSFMVGEGSSDADMLAHIDRTKDLAVGKVHDMLRVAKPATKSEPAPAGRPEVGTPLPASPPAGAAPATDAAVKPANDKERLAVEAMMKAALEAENVEAPVKKRAKKAPEAVAGTGQAISTGEERKDPDAANDGLDELFGGDGKPAAAPPTRQITDKDLNEEVQKKNHVLKDSKKIIALKETYVGPMPKQLRDIPQDKREAFLKDLAALA